MAMDFPASPAIGDLYPVPPQPGVPQYKWNGQAWDGLLVDPATFVKRRPGTMFMHAGPTPPDGAIAADGAALDRVVFKDLFEEIGTHHGAGDGVTTFNAPDGRGVNFRGVDNGRGLDAGRLFGSYQADAVISHAHGVVDPTHVHVVYDPTHNHTTNDPTHGHGVGDPSHTHPYHVPGTNQSGPNFVTTPGNFWYNSWDGTTGASGTGIWIGGAYAGTYLTASGTGVSLYGAATGITIAAAGDVETRGKNIALLACVEY